MSETKQISGVVKKNILGSRFLLPVDTAVHIRVGFTDGVFGRSKSSEQQMALGYTIGLELILSHANLPNRSVKFLPIHGFMFEVVTKWPFNWEHRKNVRQFQKEQQKVVPILTAMEVLVLQDYVEEGEVSFQRLKAFFFKEYEKQQGAWRKRKAAS